MNIFARILVHDYGFLGRATKHTGGILWEVRHHNIFLKLGWVNLRGWLDIDLSLGGLRNSQGPPQDPIDPDEKSVIGTGAVSRLT